MSHWICVTGGPLFHDEHVNIYDSRARTEICHAIGDQLSRILPYSIETVPRIKCLIKKTQKTGKKLMWLFRLCICYCRV